MPWSTCTTKLPGSNFSKEVAGMCGFMASCLSSETRIVLIVFPWNSTKRGFSDWIGQTSIIPPRGEKIPLPKVCGERSYPSSSNFLAKTDGLSSLSLSIMIAFSLHQAWVLIAFLIELEFSWNHKSPRSKFWGVRDGIRSSIISSGLFDKTGFYSILNARTNQAGCLGF